MTASRLAQAALGIAAWGWIAAVVFLPAVAFPIGQFVCHQRPDRSFFLHGHQFAVCARCTGIYLGAAIAAPLAALVSFPGHARGARLLLSLATLPTIVTWTLEFFGIVPFSNLTRFAAGLPLGATAAWLVLSQIRASPVGHRPSPIGQRQ